jgi:hypothetical protein
MKNKTIYIFIFSLLLLTGAIFSIRYVRGGIIHKIEVVRAHYSKEAQNKKLESGNTFKKEVEILEKQENAIKKAFLEENKVVDFIQQLEISAQKLGLTISVEKVTYEDSAKIEKKYTVKPVAFNVEIKGSFEQIESFILKIVQREEKLVIKEFKIYKINEEGGSEYTARIIIEGTTLSYE